MRDTEKKWDVYREALRRRVCAVCLDVADDGKCSLSRRSCAVEEHLPRILEAVAGVDSNRMDDYEAAVAQVVCRQCPDRDAEGHCGPRSDGECALISYLSLVVDAIEDVRDASRKDTVGR